MAAVLVAGWLFFGPSQLGGSATYSITEGISMVPLLRKNDLALVRAQSSYKVGDIVLYQSSTLHRPVLHRIIAIQNGHYFFKGDNNGFVDPGYATRSELTGKLWLHLPVAGGVLGWIGKPSHAAALAGLTAVFLLLGGLTVGRRRRRRRSAPTVGVQPAAAPPTPATAVHEPAPVPLPAGATSPAHRRRYLMPVTRATLVSLVVLSAVGLAAVVVGFTTPSKRTVPLQNAYTNTGTFSYKARVSKASSSYPGGFAVTGQPLFISLVNQTSFQFAYRFVSTLTHQVHGTIELKALILSQTSSWQNLYPVEKKTSFTGNTARTGGLLDVRALITLLDQLSATAGTPGASYSIDLQPIVHIVGTVGGRPIDTTFAPVLPFAATPTEVRLDVAPAVSLPGATFAPETAKAALATSLDPAESGSVPHRVANVVTLARYNVPILVVRLLGLLALALALVFAVVHDLLLRRQSLLPEEEQIAKHLGCLVTPVHALAPPVTSAPTQVLDFMSLARLALYLERPILRQTDETARTYAVDDGTRVYQYRAAPSAQPERAPSGPAPVARRRAQRPSRVLIVGGLLALTISATLVTSFTASTNVPTSSVGASNQARTISELTPGGCAGLSLTSLSIHTGNYTNSSSYVLLLGGSSSQTITDDGTHNCIVGGGGKDTVNGDRTDVCIIGPSYGTSYSGCAQRN